MILAAGLEACSCSQPEFVERHPGKISDLSVYGQESNPTTWKMATMNLAIRGIDADLGDHNADTFFNDLHKNEKIRFHSCKSSIQSEGLGRR